MRNLCRMLGASITLFMVSLGGAYAGPPVAECRDYATEMRMYAPTIATCVIDGVATAPAAVPQPALSPIAPASQVVLNSRMEYLAMIRAMTVPEERLRKRVSLLGNYEQKYEKPRVDLG